MAEQEQLEQAISAQEALRGMLPDVVVDATIAALRDKLASLQQAPRDEQRKLVTILFADLAGWTAMSERMDPEDVAAVQRAYFDAITPAIRQHGGRVEKYIGDAVLAVFGVPSAHEDDAERAVMAALAIQRAITELNQNNESQQPARFSLETMSLQLRIGIHTGLVMASIGRREDDFQVTGETVNLASRLQAAAKPGTIVVSQETCRLVSDAFATEPLLALEVKGLTGPVVAFRVVSARHVPPASESIASLRSPLMGRQAELEVLRNAIAQLGQGTGAIATVIGDAGIGKSRLVLEAFKGPAAKTVQWVTGRCLSYGSTMPYHLWLDVLRTAARIPPDTPVETMAATLRAWIERFCQQDCDEVYDTLTRLLWVATPGSQGALGVSQIEGQYSKPAVFRAVETITRGAAGSKPLAIILEDLEWADPSSIELLEHMVRLTEQIPLLLICVFRPEASPPIWTLVGRLATAYQHRHINLWLQPLSAQESQSLVINLLGGDLAADEPSNTELAARSQKLLQRVLGRAEGNPFFLEEAMRSLVNEGKLVRESERRQWRLRADLDSFTIPETVQAVLGARIDSLDGPSRRVLQMAAVIGRDFSARLLATIVPDEPALENHLHTLLRQGFIAEARDSGGPEYRFRHTLVREVAYNCLLRSERRVFHRSVAEALEKRSRGESDSDVEVLALHWQHAGEPMRAAAYLIQAGDHARQLGSSLEAIRSYEMTLNLVSGIPDANRLASSNAARERLGDVYLEHLSDHDQARVHYTAFLAGAQSPSDRARGARKLASISLLQGDLMEALSAFQSALEYLKDLPADPETNRVNCGLAYLYVSLGNLPQASMCARQSVGLARRIGDTRGLADAFRIRCIIADRQGNPRQALACALRCLALYRDLNDLPRLVMASNNAAHCYFQLGLLNQARSYLQSGLEIARRIGDTRDQALLLVTEGELLLDQGKQEEAIGRLLEALPLAQSSGVVVRVLQAHQILGAAYESLGRLEDARKHLDTGLMLCQETQHHRFQAELLLALAHLAATEGEYTRCSQVIDLAEEAGGKDPTIALTRKMLRVRAFLAWRRQQWTTAVGLLEESLLPINPREPAPQRASAQFLLAQAYAHRSEVNDLANARRHLKAAKAVFRRIGADTHLAAVESLQKSFARNAS